MLDIAGLSRSFGALKALDRVDVSISHGEIHGIIGPNGSGKTTLFNCVTGILAPDGGSVSLRGENVTGLPPKDIANRGIRRTFQAGELVPNLTVLENVMTGIFDFSPRDVADTFLRLPFRRSRREEEIRSAAMETIDMIGMRADIDRWAYDLVWAERQFVQIARAIVARPDILLLDEPASGMGMQETDTVAEIIRKIRAAGSTVVVVSHDVKMLMDLSERVTVLNFGRRIAEGTPVEVQNDERVLEAYLGSE